MHVRLLPSVDDKSKRMSVKDRIRLAEAAKEGTSSHIRSRGLSSLFVANQSASPLPNSVSVCLCLSLSVSVCLCLSVSVSVCLCLSVSLAFSLFLSLPVHWHMATATAAAAAASAGTPRGAPAKVALTS